MAWTDQCKIAAVQTIKKVAEDTGLSVRKAIAEVSKEADIPAATLQRWYYPREISEVKNDPTNKPSLPEQKNQADRTPEREEEPPKAKLHTIENGIVYDGPRYEQMAIAQLERIDKKDPQRTAILRRVIEWAENQLRG